MRGGGRAPAGAAARRGSARDGVSEVRARLQEYAARGVFRGLAERPARRGRYEFTFRWLAPSPFTLRYDPASGTLAFPDLLPNVPARSSLAAALRRFVRGRAASGLPAHRRVDPERAGVRCFVRQAALSLEVVARENQHGYGVNRAVNLVHEIFMHLHVYFPEYMWENFDAPQE